MTYRGASAISSGEFGRALPRPVLTVGTEPDAVERGLRAGRLACPTVEACCAASPPGRRRSGRGCPRWPRRWTRSRGSPRCAHRQRRNQRPRATRKGRCGPACASQVRRGYSLRPCFPSRSCSGATWSPCGRTASPSIRNARRRRRSCPRQRCWPGCTLGCRRSRVCPARGRAKSGYHGVAGQGRRRASAGRCGPCPGAGGGGAAASAVIRAVEEGRGLDEAEDAFVEACLRMAVGASCGAR